jgi:hypothetical protein
MNVAIYDPSPMGNEYFTRMFAASLRKFLTASDTVCVEVSNLAHVRDSHVVLLTDHLTEERILQLKNNGNKIIGFNVTDSSYISDKIRYAKSLALVDRIFMVSGVPRNNYGVEMAVDNEFGVYLVEKPFLDEDNWRVFDYMRASGRLLSLPYVPWTAPPDAVGQKFGQRSQKVLLRGGGHSRRFILALFLMRQDKLDPNSGFFLRDYFAEAMNPQFRFCDECRADYKQHQQARNLPPSRDCNSPARGSFDGPALYEMSDLGQWNNRCPRSFYWLAERFQERHGKVDMAIVEKMLNARWLHPKDHMEMLARMLFTSDLKWVHSIYQPQRYWEAAAAGCINVLPTRALNQDYFPKTLPMEHYLVYEETMENLPVAFTLGEQTYIEMALANRNLYDTWLNPGNFGINSNLLGHIVNEMRKA